MTDPTLTLDSAPDEIRAELDALAAALDDAIGPKMVDRNLLIATWNIRMFGSLTRKWSAGSRDSPKRDMRALHAIREIVSRFDVVAIQEVMGNLRALRELMKALGPDWAFIMSDVTRGDAGNKERMAYVFDTRRVQLSGLAAELVVPPEWISDIDADALTRQFARTPYAVSFRAGRDTFILVSLHVDYGSSAAERVPELTAIARWMADWAKSTNRWHQNLIALGDFNIDRKGDALWQAFTSTGLTVPEDLNAVPRSIHADPDEPTTDKFYDQVAWFQSGSGRRQLNMRYVRGGGFDFVPHVYRAQGLSRNALSYRLSDHYPLWVEFAH